MALDILNKKTLLLSFVVTMLLLSAASFASSQVYDHEIIDITIDESGTFNETGPLTGIIYEIAGTPGSSGTISTRIINGNPYPNAEIPEGIALAKFIEITFDYDSEDFMQGTLTFPYTDSDVSGLQEPYAIYKYIPETNSYVALQGEVDTTAKTITIILTSPEGPLFAIGGSSSPVVPDTSPLIWIAVAVAVIIIVIAVFIVVKKYAQ